MFLPVTNMINQMLNMRTTLPMIHGRRFDHVIAFLIGGDLISGSWADRPKGWPQLIFVGSPMVIIAGLGFMVVTKDYGLQSSPFCCW